MGALKIVTLLKNKKYVQEIKVTDRVALENGVALVIVNVRGQDYLMSVGGKEVNVVEKL